MEPNADLVDVLQESARFLESLDDDALPAKLKNERDALLTRMKKVLSALPERPLTTSEPYLFMDHGKRSLPAADKDANSEEYVNADKKQSEMSPQDYYESYQIMEETKIERASCEAVVAYSDCEDALLSIYSSLSAREVKSKCLKCGTLAYKEEKKLLAVFGHYSFRSYWTSLVGSHLLLYGTERDGKPISVLSIRGYQSRPAPTMIPRDQRRSESAFEIFSPGSKTLQFVAKTREDMEEWVALICHHGQGLPKKVENSRCDDEKVKDVKSTESKPRDSSSEGVDLYQDVGTLPANGGAEPLPLKHSPIPKLSGQAKGDGDRINNIAKAPLPDIPPVPMKPQHQRIERRLPSLPQEAAVRPEEPSDGEDEEDIYHKIEDLKATQHGQSVDPPTLPSTTVPLPSYELETYDDVKSLPPMRKVDKESSVPRETSSDARGVSNGCVGRGKEKEAHPTSIDDESATYDDVQTATSDLQTKKGSKEEPNEKRDEQKGAKKFLNFWNWRESPKKEGKKKTKGITRTPSKAAKEAKEPPTYDNVVDGNDQSLIEEEPEYKSPPTPRPVYAHPSIVGDSSSDNTDFAYYDDTGSCRMSLPNRSVRRSERGTHFPVNAESIHPADINVQNGQTHRVAPLDQFKTSDQRQAGLDYRSKSTIDDTFDTEHYQTPRAEPLQLVQTAASKEDGLYDDVEIVIQKVNELKLKKGTEFPAANDVAPLSNLENWRQGKRSLKKSNRNNDAVKCETNKQLSSECAEYDDASTLPSDPNRTRLNSFQKLRNRLENSLGKNASKTVAPLTKVAPGSVIS